MLTSNLPLLKTNLNKLISPQTGIFYDAAYKAAYNARYEEGLRGFEKTDNDMEQLSFDKDVKNSVKSSQEYLSRENDLKEKSDNFAKDFAKSFCDSLKSGGFMDSIADEINNHIKSIGLLITMMPQGLATVVSPVGPCSGSMIISDSTAQIQIL